ncbi:Eisosomes component [Cytospora paraplurivora]|uniref:Eisosomes component n=1 Tax=Cytospora paraplurivora TaxID=2898453 RepID=A0AAN9TZR2_9PEZI
MGGHPGWSFLALLFLAGSLTMLFFVILGGVTSHSPVNHTYFLKADTSGITGARDVSQWTYFHVCGSDNKDCSRASPAMPFGHAWADNAQNIPAGLGGHYAGHTSSRYYFYMWRFGWVFYLLTLLLEVLAFFIAFLACCSRLGAGLAAFMAASALFLFTIAVSLMSAVFTKARNHFHSAGRSASLGKYNFGFSWAAWAALAIGTIFLFLAAFRRTHDRTDKVENRRTWGRRRVRSSRSRHSSRSSYEINSKRVKDDYS